MKTRKWLWLVAVISIAAMLVSACAPAAPAPAGSGDQADRAVNQAGRLGAGLLADTKAGEDLPQQVVAGELSGDFGQSLLGLAQVLGQEFAGGPKLKVFLP